MRAIRDISSVCCGAGTDDGDGAQDIDTSETAWTASPVDLADLVAPDFVDLAALGSGPVIFGTAPRGGGGGSSGGHLCARNGMWCTQLWGSARCRVPA